MDSRVAPLHTASMAKPVSRRCNCVSRAGVDRRRAPASFSWRPFDSDSERLSAWHRAEQHRVREHASLHSGCRRRPGRDPLSNLSVSQRHRKLHSIADVGVAISSRPERRSGQTAVNDPLQPSEVFACPTPGAATSRLIDTTVVHRAQEWARCGIWAACEAGTKPSHSCHSQGTLRSPE